MCFLNVKQIGLVVLFRTYMLILAGITATAHHKPIDLTVVNNGV